MSLPQLVDVVQLTPRPPALPFAHSRVPAEYSACSRLHPPPCPPLSSIIGKRGPATSLGRRRILSLWTLLHYLLIMQYTNILPPYPTSKLVPFSPVPETYELFSFEKFKQLTSFYLQLILLLLTTYTINDGPRWGRAGVGRPHRRSVNVTVKLKNRPPTEGNFVFRPHEK